MDYDYERIVTELCAQVGIADPKPVIEGQHLTVNDGLIGFAPDEAHGGETLSVFIELGKTFPERDGELYQRMLNANIANTPDLKGAFSVHPESHHAVYRFRIDMRDLPDGAALGEALVHQQQAAQALFESVMSPS